MTYDKSLFDGVRVSPFLVSIESWLEGRGKGTYKENDIGFYYPQFLTTFRFTLSTRRYLKRIVINPFQFHLSSHQHYVSRGEEERTSPSGFVRGLFPVRSASSLISCHIGFILPNCSWYSSRCCSCQWARQWTRARVPCNSRICDLGGLVLGGKRDVIRDAALGCRLSTCPSVLIGRVERSREGLHSG